MSSSDDKPIYRPKVTHYDIPGHAHFLTFSCYRRLPLLGKDRSRWWFVQALEKARRRHHFDPWAWVLMPEHVHLLISEPERGELSVAIQMLQQITSRQLRPQDRRRFWQVRYYDFAVWTEPKPVE